VSQNAEPAAEADQSRFDCTSDDPEVVAAAVEAARRAIEDGECIVLPTDTVYGIGADAFSAAAVQRLLDVKLRGRDMPPPVLIGDPSLIRALATDVPDLAKELIAKHWPGPLSVICKIQPSLRMDLGDTDGTIALRVPDHDLARQILRKTGPMAVSSANLSGRPAAVTCDDAIEQLGRSVAVYLDGGPLGGSAAQGTVAAAVPSTIVDFSHDDNGRVLRRGALSIEVIRATLPDVVDLAEPPATAEPVDEDPEPVSPLSEPVGPRPERVGPRPEPVEGPVGADVPLWGAARDRDDPSAEGIEPNPNQPDLFSAEDPSTGSEGGPSTGSGDAPSASSRSGSTRLEPDA
jgi:L-threonylcarbamoyladenylate synthase